MITLGVILATSGAYLRYMSNRAASQEAKLVARRVFNELSDHAHHGDDNFVSVTQLRDSVLRDEFSSARRQRVWRGVEKLVEQNANVRTKVGALGSGDVGRGWRWIGSGGEGSRSRRHSGAVAMEQTNGTPSTGMSEFRRWREREEPKF
jgi:Man1-Src1p-C-terminal domain